MAWPLGFVRSIGRSLQLTALELRAEHGNLSASDTEYTEYLDLELNPH